MNQKKHWYDYLWIFSSIYLLLGFVNILFAWLGLICFITPLMIALLGGGKAYCKSFCGRGQLMSLLGNRLGLSRKAACPAFLRSKWFRYGFLLFFLAMFASMLFNTYLVFTSAKSLQEVVTLFWSLKLPWHWASSISSVPPWTAQFAFGFYSVMLTSTLLGFITMALWMPRTWCVYCPMGTMTQLICKVKASHTKAD